MQPNPPGNNKNDKSERPLRFVEGRRKQLVKRIDRPDRPDRGELDPTPIAPANMVTTLESVKNPSLRPKSLLIEKQKTPSKPPKTPQPQQAPQPANGSPQTPQTPKGGGEGAAHDGLGEGAPAKAATAAKLGAGFMGTVFFPPLPCQNAELEKQLQEISRHTPLVLKHTELAMGLTAVHTSNSIRDRWSKVQRLKFHHGSGISLPMWSLMHQVRTRPPEDFFVLCLAQVCSNCITPDGFSLSEDGAKVGIYMPHAGKKWTDALPPGSPLTLREIKIVRHTICALLLLHGIGITHNDIRRANITVDDKSVPRLIDWELRSRPRTTQEEKNDLYIDQLPSDRRAYQAFIHGFFSTPQDLVRFDWTALHRVFVLTWMKELAHHPPQFAKLLTQVCKLINNGSDKDALLAWTILEQV